MIAGQSPPSETYNETGEGLPFLQGNADFTDCYPRAVLWCSVPKKTAAAGDTLISVRAPVGEVNRADQSYAIGRGLAALRAIGCDPDFLYYGIQRWRWSLQRVAQGTTFDAVTARHFAAMRVALPIDAHEQKKIARILLVADRAIEAVGHNILAAAQLRRAVVAGLLASGLTSEGRLRNLNHEGLVRATPLGPLPAAWELSTVGHEFALQTGITLNEARRSYYSRHPYLRVANVRREQVSLDDVQELGAAETELAPRRLQENDLLIVEGHANRREIGRCALTPQGAIGMTFQNHLFRLRTRGRVMPEFACLWLNSEYAQRYWDARCGTSSGLNTINQRSLRRLVLPVPNPREQQAIAELAAAQQAHIGALINRRTVLSDLKRGLAGDLLTGRVRPALELEREVITA